MKQPTLSIIVPVFNEANTLPTIIKRLLEHCPESQIIYINDGSTDVSEEIIQRCLREQDILLNKTNGGKGSAIRMGIQHARGTYTIIQDADLEYHPSDIVRLLAYAQKHQSLAVFGSRRMHGRSRYAHIAYYIGGVTTTWLFNLLYGTRLSDQHTCYKLIQTSILQSIPLTEQSFSADVEICCHLAKRKIHIDEVPISYAPRTKKEGKKIGWIDGFSCIRVMIQHRFSFR